MMLHQIRGLRTRRDADRLAALWSSAEDDRRLWVDGWRDATRMLLRGEVLDDDTFLELCRFDLFSRLRVEFRSPEISEEIEENFLKSAA
jgi:hypothetical protein